MIITLTQKKMHLVLDILCFKHVTHYGILHNHLSGKYASSNFVFLFHTCLILNLTVIDLKTMLKPIKQSKYLISFHYNAF